MTDVVVHVAGDTLLRGSRWRYSVSPDPPCTLEASSTAVPVAVKAALTGRLDLDGSKLLVIVPHSLVTFGAKVGHPPSVGIDVLEWIDGATSDLLEKFPALLGEVNTEGCSLDSLSRLLERVRKKEALVMRVVQVRGTFSMQVEEAGGDVRLSFSNGEPSHTFVEVYRSLLSMNADRIVLDMSQGWNHLTLMAYMGVLAYAETRGTGVEVIPMTSMPVSVRIPRKSKAGGDVEAPPPPPADIVGVGEAYTVYNLMRTISGIAAARGEFSPQLLVDVWQILEREFSRYGERSTSEGSRKVMKALIDLRKASCALGTAILPYIHLSLRRLSDDVERLREVIRDLDGMMDGEEFLKVRESEPSKIVEGSISLSYELGSPLSYTLMSVIESLADRLELTGLQEFLTRDFVSLRFAKKVGDLFFKLGMKPNGILIYKEISLIDEQGNPIERIEEVVSHAKRGTALGYMSSYIARMRELVSRGVVKPHCDLPDVYPLYVMAEERGDSTFRSLLDRVFSKLLGKPIGDLVKDLNSMDLARWSRFREEVYQIIISADTPGALDSLVEKKRNKEWLLNLKTAEELARAVRTSRSSVISSDRLVSVIRNLIAHVGLQHFSIRNVLPVVKSGELEDVMICYNRDLFEGIEEEAFKEIRRHYGIQIPDDLLREMGTLCDISVPIHEGQG